MIEQPPLPEDQIFTPMPWTRLPEKFRACWIPGSAWRRPGQNSLRLKSRSWSTSREANFRPWLNGSRCPSPLVGLQVRSVRLRRQWKVESDELALFVGRRRTFGSLRINPAELAAWLKARWIG